MNDLKYMKRREEPQVGQRAFTVLIHISYTYLKRGALKYDTFHNLHMWGPIPARSLDREAHRDPGPCQQSYRTLGCSRLL